MLVRSMMAAKLVKYIAQELIMEAAVCVAVVPTYLMPALARDTQNQVHLVLTSRP